MGRVLLLPARGLPRLQLAAVDPDGAGLGPSVASTGITVFNLGGVAGAIGGGLLIARFGSRATMLTMTAVAIAGALVLSPMSITLADAGAARSS